MKEVNAVEVHEVKKKFRVYMDKGHTLKELTLFSKRRRYQERIVLDGISFEIKKGEAVGLIGHNGCGKSTLLKLLTKILYPDSGEVEMRGRVSSLIELGAGFHPDMSGRENIYINASIFGLTRKEIDARMQDIIDFSELEQFIDNPVRTYSSGMYMRLAFSVAINVNADILLIDEILAVGDSNFQSKCFNKLKEVKGKGTTIVLVSHSLEQIEQFCEKSIWINNGKIETEGKPRTVHPQYLDFMGKLKVHASSGQHVQSVDGGGCRWGSGAVRISNIKIFDLSHLQRTTFITGEEVNFEIQYEVNTPIEDAMFGIGIFRQDGLQCYGTNTRLEHFPIFNLTESGKFTLKFETIELLPGIYNIDIAVQYGPGVSVDYYTQACSLEIYSDKSDIGVCRLKHSWEGVIADD